MKLLPIFMVLFMATSSYAGKISWDKNGKPIIERSGNEKGCKQGGFDKIIKENKESCGKKKK